MSADNRPLRPVRGWDLLWRGSFAAQHGNSEYVIDVDYFDFSERIHLYCDGALLDTKKSPATFALNADTEVVAAMSLYGMKRVDLIDRARGATTHFQPRAGTAEAWRAALAQRHPILNRWIGIASWTVLACAAATQLPVLFNSSVAQLTGSPLPQLELPVWLNTVLGIAGLLAALDRALQLKYNRWLDD